MADRLIVFDDVAQTCDLRALTPYPLVTAGNASVGNATTTNGTTGQVTNSITAYPDRAAALAGNLLIEIRDLAGNLTGYAVAP